MFRINGVSFATGGSSVVISTGSAGGEKTNFGDENVDSIDVSSSVHLNGTRVSDDVDAGGSITATSAIVGGKIDAGGSATLTHTTCYGKVDAGGSITSTHSTVDKLDAGGSITVGSSTVSSTVKAGGSVTAHRCERLGKVSAGGSAEIDECPIIIAISAGGHVTLKESKVTKNVSAGSQATVFNSTIGGKLTCSAERMIIEGSTIDTMELRCSHSVSVTSMGGSLFGSVSVGNSSVISMGGSCVVFEGDGDVMINGVPLSELKKASSAARGVEKKSAKCGPKQILELKNSTVRNIIFEGGNGEVILSGTSTLTGTVTGGVVKE